MFVDGATGAQGAESDTGLTYNPSTGNLTATKFTGDGSSLTGIAAGVTVQDEGSALSTAGTTLNFVGSGVVASGTGATKTITISGGSGATNVGITTNLTGSFTASAGSPSTINTYAYNADDIMIEYSVFIKNGSNYQSQKVFAMRDGTSIDSTEFAIMFSSTQLADFDVTISGSNMLLRATPKTGVSGSTTYRIKREVS